MIFLRLPLRGLGANSELQKKTQQLVTNLDRTDLKINWGAEKERNIVISEGKIVGKRLMNQLCNAKKSYETISPWDVCASMLSSFSDNIKHITKKSKSQSAN